ncbi:MAG: hypothetical protein M3N95_04855 [Actinomycetota bacterium]|nr:hypothetical protein [Actinomycetota bacterium]
MNDEAGTEVPAAAALVATTDSSLDQSEFEAGYRLGFPAGYERGYASGVQDEGDAWTSIMTGVSSVLRNPEHAELERRRQPDYTPCPYKCRACSRCIASMAYWARGGRPYMGRAAELHRLRDADTI